MGNINSLTPPNYINRSFIQLRQHYWEPRMIETIPETQIVIIDNFNKDELYERVSNLPANLNDQEREILSEVFKSDMLDDHAKQFRDIHFMNVFCESLIHVHNPSGEYTKDVMAIKISDSPDKYFPKKN